MYLYASYNNAKKAEPTKKSLKHTAHDGLTVQRAVSQTLRPNSFNVVGENHSESNGFWTRHLEKKLCREKIGSSNYWREFEFRRGIKTSGFFSRDNRPAGDNIILRTKFSVAGLMKLLTESPPQTNAEVARWLSDKRYEHHQKVAEVLTGLLYEDYSGKRGAIVAGDPTMSNNIVTKYNDFDVKRMALNVYNAFELMIEDKCLSKYEQFKNCVHTMHAHLITIEGQDIGTDRNIYQVSRSEHMHDASNQAEVDGITGVWKIGTSHVQDILSTSPPHSINYTLITKEDFYTEYQAYHNKTHP